MATTAEETFGTAKMAEEAPHSLGAIMKRETTALWGTGSSKIEGDNPNRIISLLRSLDGSPITKIGCCILMIYHHHSWS
jgi:hypothetical protein